MIDDSLFQSLLYRMDDLGERVLCLERKINEGGGGGTITVDDAISGTSTNPVQNRAIFNSLTDISNSLSNVSQTVQNIQLAIQDSQDRGVALEEKSIFIAEFNVTSAQQINNHIGQGHSTPILVKRGDDYYTSLIVRTLAEDKASIRALGSVSGSYYIFNYTVTNSSWSSATQGLQNILVSGTNIKTINTQSLLGSGDISV